MSYPVADNLARCVTKREVQDKICYRLQHQLHVTEDFVQRLGLEKDLEGHNGCVNCLEWNESGTILASGSDDLQVNLWDPFRYRKLHTIQTGHHGNIFSVKFLPRSGDSTIVSAAADCRIRVHDVHQAETTHVCSCHTGRVKRLATAPNLPYMFWSAGEDGLIMQFDLRTPHTCTSEVNNILVNLTNHLGRYAEAKCVTVNPYRPELIAIGANDPYVRLYDRRMIKLSSIQYPTDHVPRSNWDRQNYVTSKAGEGEPEDNLPFGCVQYFVAGHLPKKQQDYRKKFRPLASTYLTFGPSGNELLVNLGGEQIYLFDVNNQQRRKNFKFEDISIESIKPTKDPTSTNGYSNGYRNGSNGLSANGLSVGANGVNVIASANGDSSTRKKKNVMSSQAEALKLKANHAFEKQKYTLAVSLYNKAISISPNSAILYGNRASALMKRGWDGDIYAAMRDCYTALHLDPNHIRAHFRLARCLHELQWTDEASECLQMFKAKFPEHAHSHACRALDKDILTATTQRSSEGECAEDREGVEVKRSSNNVSAASSTASSSSTCDSGSGSEGSPPQRCPLSDQEKAWRAQAADYTARFCGHCNTTTDIKEANFFGSNGQYIVAGSDDGSFFIWDRFTTNIVRVLRGDDSIVNCLQPHPSYCLLATSGIDPVVRLWSPLPEDGKKNDREVLDSDDAASANQKRMNADPFEVMLMNMGYRIPSVPGDEEGSDDVPRESAATIQCRPS